MITTQSTDVLGYASMGNVYVGVLLIMFCPEATGYDPDTGGCNPGTTGYNPDTGGCNPGTTGYDPDTGGCNPGTTGYNPDRCCWLQFRNYRLLFGHETVLQFISHVKSTTKFMI